VHGTVDTPMALRPSGSAQARPEGGLDVSTDSFRLLAYLDETNDGGRFLSPRGRLGKRLTYKTLIGGWLPDSETRSKRPKPYLPRGKRKWQNPARE
jgi:hypothetical protein